MSDHNYTLWRNNPVSPSIVGNKWLKDNLSWVELQLPPQFNLPQDRFYTSSEIIKQMETLIADVSEQEAEGWMQPLPIQAP